MIFASMTYEHLRARIDAVRGDIESRYPIRLLGIFGSAAREETGPASDVDILVEPRPGLSLFKLASAHHELEQALGRPVDLVFESSLKPPVRSRVMAELRPL